MNIATALNKKYVNYTIVMLTSLCENNPTHIEAYLLNTELDDADFDLFGEALSKYDIQCVDAKVDAAWFDSRCPHTEEWSMETYYRLLLPEILPAELDRLLYLDVDLIINQEIGSLYDRDMEGKDLWAADNTNGTTTPELMMAKQREMFAPWMAKGYRYFNAGVMLLNMKQIREKYGSEAYVRAMAEWDYAMDCPDQDILNWVHREHIGYLDWRKYDLFSKHAHQIGITYDEVKRDTAIVHYAGAKPWNTTNLHYDIEQLWWDYAAKTPIYAELLEAFQQSVVVDRSVELQIRELADSNKRLVEISQTLAERVKDQDRHTAAVSFEETEEERNARETLKHFSPDPAASSVISKRNREKKDIDLSIIIPCYNVENYVATCLESVLSQRTKHQIEIIVVNDGSTDGTDNILKQYATRDNVILIEQENRGLSGARNSGIHVAGGRYLLFLDSDDYLVENSLEGLLEQAEAMDIDILEGGLLQLIGEELVPMSKKFDDQESVLCDPFSLSGYGCGKLIRSALFERVQFPEGYLFEDSIMAWLLYPRCERAARSTTALYVYRRNESGITSSAREGNPKVVDTWWITEQMFRDLANLHLTVSQDLYDMALSQIILNFVRTASLGEEIKMAVYHVTSMWFLRNFSGFTATKDYLLIVEKALRLRNYVLYEKACITAWRAMYA